MNIYNRLERRCQRLIDWLEAQPPQGLNQRMVDETIRPVILANRLQHLWGEFCCELVVRSAMGKCGTRTGRQLARAHGIKRVSDIPVITGKPLAGFNAKWNEPQYTISFSASLGVANQSEINVGLSSADTYNLNNLRILRNYVIHPNRHTGANYAAMIRHYGLWGIGPDQFMHQRLASGATIFEVWIRNLLDSAWNAVE